MSDPGPYLENRVEFGYVFEKDLHPEYLDSKPSRIKIESNAT